MNNAENAPLDDDLVELLAAYDDALAKWGRSAESTLPPDDLSPERQQDFAYLQLLRRVLQPAPALGGEAVRAFLQPNSSAGSLGRLGHYEIIEVIGHGAMGVVLKARDEALQRIVAIKVMAPHLALEPTARKRFIREAQAAAAVRDEHIIDIHAVEETKGLPYLVMEYVRGVSLQERLQRGRLALEEILRIGTQIAAGLAAAHAQGLIHRDVKPANILLENGVPRVKITDFGLARAVDDVALTQSGMIAGTPQFMAPEQARAEPIDHRADLFSLGSVLYTMCAGQSPFAGGNPIAVLKRVCEDTPRPVRDLNPEVPDWLAAIIQRLHAKDPADRFPSAAEVGERLANGLAHLQQPSLVPPPPSRAPRPPVAKRVRRWSMVALLALALGLGIYLSGPTMYLFLIGKGRLEIQTDDPYVQLIVKKGNKQVALLDLQSEAVVDLDPGNYELELTDGRADLRLSAAKITLARGGQQVVGVSEDPDFVGEVRRFEGHERMVRCVAISPDGRWALSGSHDKTVRLWDLKSGKEVRRFLGHTDKVTGVTFSPDGSRILSAGDDKTVRLWDLQTGKQIHQFLGHEHYVVGVAITPDGRQALSASYDQTLRLWDLDTGKQVRAFHGHSDAVWSMAISTDGRRAVSGSWDGSARVWDVHTGEELRRFTRHDGRIWSLALSPNGRLAASGGGDSKIWLWEVDSAKEVRCLPGHDGHAVGALAFSPNGRKVLSGGTDSNIRLWDVATGRQLHRFDSQRGAVAGVAFSADGHYALSGGGDDALPKSDNVLRLWRLSLYMN